MTELDPRRVVDPELLGALAVVGGVFPSTITPDLIPFMRRSYASAPRADLLGGRPLEIVDVELPGPNGSLVASVISRTGTSTRRGACTSSTPAA